MADLILKDVPRLLYAKLELRAAEHNSTIEEETVESLCFVMGVQTERRAKLLERIRASVERQTGVWLTDEDLRKAREERR